MLEMEKGLALIRRFCDTIWEYRADTNQVYLYYDSITPELCGVWRDYTQVFLNFEKNFVQQEEMPLWHHYLSAEGLAAFLQGDKDEEHFYLRLEHTQNGNEWHEVYLERVGTDRVLIGSRDVREAQRNATVAQAVLPDYDYVCRIDIATKSYVFYYADDTHTIVPQHAGEDYEKIMTEFNRVHVVPEESEELSRNMRLDNLIRQLDKAPDYVLYATSFDPGGLAYKKLRFCYADSSKKDILLSRSDVSSAVREKLKLTEELRRSQAEMKHVLETTTELMFQYDPQTDEIYLDKTKAGHYDKNISRADLLEYLVRDGWLEPSFREVLDGCLIRMRQGEEHCSATIQARREKDRRRGWTWYRLTLFDYQDEYTHERKVLGYLQNVDKDMLQQAKLRHQAQTDALTGLLNVGEGKKQVNAILQAQGEDPAGYNAMFLMDVDDFKSINDTRGHMMGDTALTQLAQALSHTFRARDVVYRMGGDEFIVFMEELLAPEQDLPAILERFRHQLEHAHEICPFLTVSIGVYVSNRPQTYESYYAQADRALYETKANGKNHYTIRMDEA